MTIEDLEALALVGAVCAALLRAGIPDADVGDFAADASSAAYDRVLRTAMGWMTLASAVDEGPI